MKLYKNHKKEFLNKLIDETLNFNGEEKKIALYIKKCCKKVSYMNLSELLEAAETSEENVKSYLAKMGYNSYDDFRKELREVIMVGMKTTEAFKISMDMMHPKVNNILDFIVKKETDNLNEFKKTFDEEAFRNIIEAIINANDIILVGTRASAPIAIYAEYIFNKIGKRSRKIISGGTENFDFLSLIDRDTLVLAFGFARYPKDTIKILSFFRKKNFKIISVTDNYLSPLARFSDMIYTVPIESYSFTDSYVIPVSLVNIIAILISQLDEDNSMKHLTEFEEIAKDIGFYF
ncbi:MurR/RpiR family transcriptional regulator [Lutispora saccharofermentans]|uniref:MurR/RpiR family transcriptional regulator n=1 Tax=Lutispora saccharofermentans TaxID=3024236 RepID=A0ABT1NI05_9FIRM|nr:MurR/RpiR family transcriptional regulator [Lutispora saccharofermentans]MCQ1529501.1 MurR/RpiR family transcriptional regulator [Lutispora saccharofermentans]